jgi:NAD(P)H dehydrogenase (quinone)
VCEATEPAIPTAAPYADLADLHECIGLAWAARLLGKHGCAEVLIPPRAFWLKYAAGKPPGVFTSTSTMHGARRAPLPMMLPLLHHGMVIVGVPYTEPELSSTTSGGTPYGASHVAGVGSDRPISAEEHRLCMALGHRLAQTALKLAR